MEAYVVTNLSVVIVDLTSDKKIMRDNETEIVVSELSVMVCHIGT